MCVINPTSDILPHLFLDISNGIEGKSCQNFRIDFSLPGNYCAGTADDDEGLYYNLHDPDDPGTPSLEDILMHRGTSAAQPVLRAGMLS